MDSKWKDPIMSWNSPSRNALKLLTRTKIRGQVSVRFGYIGLSSRTKDRRKLKRESDEFLL